MSPRTAPIAARHSWPRSAWPTASSTRASCANFGGPRSGERAGRRDGANLFVGGNFTTLNGVAARTLVKAQRQTGARNARFAPKAIRRPRCSTWHFADGVVYAAGEFGKIGAPPAGNQNYVGNAAGFNPTTGAWTGWFAGANSKVESIAVSPDTARSSSAATSPQVKKPSQHGRWPRPVTGWRQLDRRCRHPRRRSTPVRSAPGRSTWPSPPTTPDRCSPPSAPAARRRGAGQPDHQLQRRRRHAELEQQQPAGQRRGRRGHRQPRCSPASWAATTTPPARCRCYPTNYRVLGINPATRT